MRSSFDASRGRACYDREVPERLLARLETLAARGVVIVDPRQTWIGEDVDVERIEAGAVLFPGTRLEGERTYLGPNARVGHEGPATLVDSVLDEQASIASGFARGAVLLRGASAGANAHLREGTLLEEEASTAHAVGLKQTILLPFVTLGSLVNLCDCLVAGGRARSDHSEVGSGYIHFNFTPWGASGDKATPSLVGDVVHGVFLNRDRIFLGGSGGLVGPSKVGYGAVVGAGQVTRKDVADHTLSVQAARKAERAIDPHRLDAEEPRRAKNIAYIGQLVALRRWYKDVRMPGEARIGRGHVLEAALELIDQAIAERVKRLGRFVHERGGTVGELDLDPAATCPYAIEAHTREHVEWVQALTTAQIEAGQAWLASIAAATAASDR